MRIVKILCLAAILGSAGIIQAQITPPGYEREIERRDALAKTPILDRDSVTIIDTTEIFDPVTYESEVKIITARYSLRDYCKTILYINNPDILLDHKPHTIPNPQTFEDMIIQLNSAGKIDTLPNKQ